MRSSLLRMRSSLVRMRSSLVDRASDCQCTSCNGPGFDPSIRRYSGIWGAVDEAVLNIVRKKKKKSPQKIFKNKTIHTYLPFYKLASLTSQLTRPEITTYPLSATVWSLGSQVLVTSEFHRIPHLQIQGGAMMIDLLRPNSWTLLGQKS